MAAISALLNPNKKTKPYGIAGIGSVINQTPPVQPKPTPLPTQNNGLPGIAGLIRTAGVKPTGVASVVNQTQPTQPQPKFTDYKPFEYTAANIESDPTYQAALATARQNIQTGQNNTLANLVANGQGHSSYADTVTQQIANKEMGNVSNNILPQLIQQAYQRHNDEFNNHNLVQTQNYGVTQDAFNNGITEGQLTGNYQSPEQKSVISQILSLKQQAETPGISAQQREGLSAQADGLRSRLTALGGNAEAFGANVSMANTNPNAGQRTLAGILSDQGVKNDNLNAAQIVEQQTGRLVTPQSDWSGLYRQAANPNTPLSQSGQNNELGKTQTMAALTGQLPDGTPTTAEQQRQLGNLWAVADATGTIPDELASLYGIPKGTQTQSAYQFAKNLGLQQDQNDLAWVNADNKMSGAGGQGQTISPTAAGSYLADLINPTTTNILGKSTKTPVTDPAKREQLFLDAYNQGVAPGTDAVEMLVRAGYTPEEIAKYKGKYPQVFQAASSSRGIGSSGVSVPQQYQGVINGVESKYGLPSGLLGRLADTESNFNPNAKNKSGASGMFQFMPDTAKGFGIDPFNVDQSADAAGKMLSSSLKQYGGDWNKALAAYNWGSGNLAKAIKQYGANWLDHAPTETKNYIKKILG